MQPLPADAKVKRAQVSERVVSKKIKGEVIFVSKDLIVIEHYRKGSVSKEILIPLDVKTSLRRFGSKGNVGVGDIVNVAFKETYNVDEDGKRSDFKRMAVQVTLMRSAN